MNEGRKIPPPRLRQLGQQPYIETWQAMQRFTDRRDGDTPDEFWLVQHPAVFTQGLAGKPEHLLAPGDIPVVQTDRGGQVTYHGPGQLIIYTLLDLRRLGIGPRRLVTSLEQAIIACLASFAVASQARRDAPGVYVDGRKIASIGLRVRRGCSYHGLALNVDMDLAPFQRINPCGYAGLSMARLADQAIGADMATIERRLLSQLLQRFGWETTPAESLIHDCGRSRQRSGSAGAHPAAGD